MLAKAEVRKGYPANLDIAIRDPAEEELRTLSLDRHLKTIKHSKPCLRNRTNMDQHMTTPHLGANQANVDHAPKGVTQLGPTRTQASWS